MPPKKPTNPILQPDYEIADHNVLDELLLTMADRLNPDAPTSLATGWKPLPGPQTIAYESLADELFYGGAAGGGKGNSLESDILTPFGFKKAGEIRVGDQLCNPDGSIQNVLAVYPLGKRRLFEFTFADGAKTRVTEDHVWYYWYAYASKRIKAARKYILYSPEKGIHYEDVRGRLGLTSDLYAYHKKQEAIQATGGRPYWIIMPLTNPVQFTAPINRYDQRYMISPYLLGVLIGDGSLSVETSIHFTSADQEIIDRVQRELPEGDRLVNLSDPINFSILGGRTLAALRYFDLMGKRSEIKFIPKPYLWASVEDRFALMQGLIDTGGYVDDRGHISYTTTSEYLAKDVQFLARSLGAKASISQKRGAYKNAQGERIECQIAYTVCIQGEGLDRFVSLSHKRDRCRAFNGGVSEPGRRVVSIEEVEPDEAVCFAVDNPNSLYICDDFIVTHNTDFLLGWAITAAKKSIIFRREYPQLKHIIQRSRELLHGSGAKYNGQDYIWTNIPGDRILEFGSVPSVDAVMKYQGRPHDFIGFDEVSNFLRDQYTFLIGWNRSEIPGQRVRVVAAGNPPTNTDGEWVIQRWAAWIDPGHPNPAKPGELRWFARIDDEDKELESGEPFEWKGELIYPRSRTFVPAKVTDNPHYGKEYIANLQSMPEPLRSKMLFGDFGIVVKDDPYQVIPTAWVRAARERYDQLVAEGQLQLVNNVNPSYGCDPAESGKDWTAFVKMTANVVQWVKYIQEPDTMKLADWLRVHIDLKSSPLGVDAIGIGAGLHYRMKQLGYRSVGVKVSTASPFRDRTGQLEFMNLRSGLWWMVRDMLDPDGDVHLALPPDDKLCKELIMPRWSMAANGRIVVESQESIRERLGRSPDGANALMMAVFVSRAHKPPLRIF